MQAFAKTSAWLLFLAYLLLGLGGIVSAAEVGGSGCAKGSTAERCCQTCEEESSLSHLRSTTAAKRLVQIPLPASSTRSLPLLPAPPWTVVPPLGHNDLPNFTLATLRTVVLLN